MASKVVSNSTRKWYAICTVLLVHLILFMTYNLALDKAYPSLWTGVSLFGTLGNSLRVPFNFATNVNISDSPDPNGTQSTPDESCGYLVRAPPGGRLGNMMFSYASFFGMVKMQEAKGRKNAFIRVWSQPYELDAVFPGLSIPREMVTDKWYSESKFKSYYEGDCCHYHRLDSLACDGTNVSVHGYRQSHKYFSKYSHELKNEFNFTESIRNSSQLLFNTSLSQGPSDYSTCITVGVHLRRGDFMSKENRDFGHWPAQADYLQRVVDFYEKWHFGHEASNYTRSDCLVFLVFGNDYEWNLNATWNVSLLNPNRTHFVVNNGDSSSPEVDLCTLTLCDHVAVSTGSFGWWAAFLGRGMVTYQKEYARKGSRHFKEYAPRDYFMPGWIAL